MPQQVTVLACLFFLLHLDLKLQLMWMHDAVVHKIIHMLTQTDECVSDYTRLHILTHTDECCSNDH